MHNFKLEVLNLITDNNFRISVFQISTLNRLKYKDVPLFVDTLYTNINNTIFREQYMSDI